MTKLTDLIKKAEAYADSKERRGCAYWTGLYHGFMQGYEVRGDEQAIEAEEQDEQDYFNGLADATSKERFD